MNTHTFGNHSVTCPICQRSESLKRIKTCRGLFTCPHCQERLVVSWSGHYVRDPHNYRQEPLAHLLRRQSRPWARIARDCSFLKRPCALVAIGSALLLGISVISLETCTRQQNNSIDGLQEGVTELVNPPKNSSE